jgi:hypothetical protein
MPEIAWRMRPGMERRRVPLVRATVTTPVNVDGFLVLAGTPCFVLGLSKHGAECVAEWAVDCESVQATRGIAFACAPKYLAFDKAAEISEGSDIAERVVSAAACLLEY